MFGRAGLAGGCIAIYAVAPYAVGAGGAGGATPRFDDTIPISGTRTTGGMIIIIHINPPITHNAPTCIVGRVFSTNIPITIGLTIAVRHS